MKKLAIIIPAYNVEKFITDCIMSLESQLNDDCEVIIVDDGSTDQTKELISEHLNNYIKYYYQNNQGAPTARNNGFLYSNSEYCLFLDGDDSLQSNVIPRILRMLNGEDIIIGNYDVVDESGFIIKKQDMSFYLKSRCKQLIGEECLKASLLPPNPGNKVFRSSFLKDNSLFFDDVKIGQDLNFYLKCLLVAKRVKLDESSFFFYRIVSDSISRTYDERILDIKKALDYVKNFYTNHDAYEKYKKYISVVERLSYISQYFKVDKIPVATHDIKKKLEQYIKDCDVPISLHTLKRQKTYIKYILYKVKYRKI